MYWRVLPDQVSKDVLYGTRVIADVRNNHSDGKRRTLFVPGGLAGDFLLVPEEEEELEELVVTAPGKSGRPGEEDKQPMLGMDRKPNLVVCRWAGCRCCGGCSL
jgi:hypothetical protein